MKSPYAELSAFLIPTARLHFRLLMCVDLRSKSEREACKEKLNARH